MTCFQNWTRADYQYLRMVLKNKVRLTLVLESRLAFRRLSEWKYGGACQRIGRHGKSLSQKSAETSNFLAWHIAVPKISRKPQFSGTAMCHTGITVRKIAATRNCSALQCAVGAHRAHVACTTCAPHAPVMNCAHLGCVRARPSALPLHTLCSTWVL